VHPAYHRRDEAAPLDNRRLQSLPRPNPDAPELQLSPAAAPRPRAAPSIGASVEGMTDDFYTDPMSQRDSRYGGRWLAAFAPVGNTEMVVIVQQRYDEVIQPDKTLTRNLALALGSALAIGLLFTAAVAWYGSRRRNG
jgi:hypothetical protein